MILLLGVLSLLLCQIIGPVVWFQGRRMLADIDRHREPVSGRGSIEVGVALGALATLLLVAAPVLVGVIFLFDQ